MSFVNSILVPAAFVILVSLAAVSCGDAPPEMVSPRAPAEIAPAMPSPTAMVASAQPTSVPTAAPPQPTATSGAVPEQHTPVTPAPTALPARAEPVATEAEVGELVLGNSTFAFDLYRELSSEGGNLFYSPYSISVALGMTYAGARNETESQMADTLHFGLPQDALHPAFNTLHLDLDSRSGGKQDNDPSAFRLNVTNALWGRQGYQFLDEFTTVVGENYGGAVRPTDFVGQPEESRLRINNWVADETEDRITDLIPQGKFEERPPALVLTNAIYFNAAWVRKFKAMPTPSDFHKLDGETIAVPMMNRTGKRRYASGDGYQAVDLLYSFSKMSMTILLPDSGTFEAFEDSLDDELAAKIIEDLETRGVVLTMPKFEFQSKFDLVDTLMTMGMTNSFDPSRADFSGMDARCTFNPDLGASPHDHQGSIPGVRSAQRHRSQDARVLGTARIPKTTSSQKTQDQTLHRGHRPDTRGRPLPIGLEASSLNRERPRLPPVAARRVQLALSSLRSLKDKTGDGLTLLPRGSVSVENSQLWVVPAFATGANAPE